MWTTHRQVPGEPTKTGTTLLETSTSTIQAFGPVNRIHQHLCAFHFYSHDKTRQIDHRQAYNYEIMLSKVKVPLNPRQTPS
ncbi:hypothetical protein ACFX13_016304 [Malus domestica]